MSEPQGNHKIQSDPRNWARQDRLDGVWWGLVMIWGALILLADLVGWAGGWAWWNGWGLFFAGAGILSLLGAVVRLLMPAYRPKWVASLVFGAIFLAIGLSSWNVANWVWVVLLLILGVVTLLSALTRQSS